MLIGKQKYAVDSKNRICIPHKFRGELGTKCVLSKDILYRCLNLYSIEQWTIFSKKIEELPAIKMRSIRQIVFANSDEVELDSQGRIVLNRELGDFAGLLAENPTREVMIIGMNTYAQIWNVSEWENFEKELNAEGSMENIIGGLLEMGF